MQNVYTSIESRVAKGVDEHATGRAATSIANLDGRVLQTTVLSEQRRRPLNRNYFHHLLAHSLVTQAQLLFSGELYCSVVLGVQLSSPRLPHSRCVLEHAWCRLRFYCLAWAACNCQQTAGQSSELDFNAELEVRKAGWNQHKIAVPVQFRERGTPRHDTRVARVSSALLWLQLPPLLRQRRPP